MKPRGFDPLDPKRKPDLRQPDRAFDPPVPDGTPGSAVDRTLMESRSSADDAVLEQAMALGLMGAEHVSEELAKRDADQALVTPTTKKKRLTKAQRAAVAKATTAQQLRRQGFSVPEIAEELGVAASTVTGYFTQHRHALAEGELDDRLDHIASPLAVDNLVHGLLAGDKDYTLKTLEGRGLFKRHADQGEQVDMTPPPLIVRAEGNVSIALGAPPPALPTGEPAKGFIVGQRDKRPTKQVTGTVIHEDDDGSD